MKYLTLLISLMLCLSFGGAAKQVEHQSENHSKEAESKTALKKLIDGNRRFSTHHMKHPDETIARRISLARKGQHPFAIVLSCSDSRIPPEIVFDEGLGDLFVVRVAGNIADDAVIASIEYAAEHLGASLLIVLGHENCGAVNAAINNLKEGHLTTLVEAIHPAVEKVRSSQSASESNGEKSHFSEQVSQANVEAVVAKLSTSEPVLAQLVQEKRLVVVGGYYHLSSGKVSLLHK